jgi:CMP-N,N'-diacetyllegionaminic acid synthase
MRTLGLIPARGGSRRIPRKNLAVLGGSTLVRRALETALAASCFDVVALSSEDDDILAEASALDALTVLRPAELASDGALAYDVAMHALTVLERERPRFDALAVVQCTSPFTAPDDLAGALEMLERTGAESVVSVVRLETAHHPLKLKVLEGDRLLPYLADDRMVPSHELPPVWVRNGSIYVSRRDVLERGVLVGEDVRGFEMPAERSFDIDTERDLAFAEFMLSRQL